MEIIKDIIYGYSVNERGEKEAQKLDIYLPKEKSKEMRTIVFVHGGGFRIDTTKEQSYIVKFAEEFAKQGHICISIEYRRRSSEKCKCMEALVDAVEDLDMALEWVRSNGEKYSWDKNNIILIGGSAGGRTVVTFGISAEDNPLFNKKLNKKGVKAIGNLWGSPEKHFRVENISESIPPIVSFHGTKDAIIDYQNSLDLQEFLGKRGVISELYSVIGAPHTPVDEENFAKITKAINGFLHKIF